ncbi:porin family protein [Vibrio barjaei]|jgi:opacity protein-like surface antigen|uniref:porin family protein n=1 Tax=Vibrio barjaei TaxID=1676683 RepID=UPI0007BC615D|nr:porin family protein [Vibrio barjaei]MCY9872574.1 porin family protein [Vibrio barjaei]OIN27551.1 hypothetical protein AWH66_2012730 [Vibrio barjaei]
MKAIQKILLLGSTICALPSMAHGIYLGASVGYGNQENQIENFSSGTGFLQAGFKFNDNISAEYRFGGVDENSSELNLSSYSSVYLRGSYELKENIEIYGLLGVTQARVSGYISGDYSSNIRNISSPSYGIGARYAVSDNIGLMAEYVAVATSRDYSLSAVHFGADYRF